MIELLLTLAFFNFLAVMTPGPDFAIVTHNTIAYSRKHGLYTAFGVSSAVMIHATYCSLGLALIITHTPILFNIIKIIGGTYLVSMGVSSLRSKAISEIDHNDIAAHKISPAKAFRQGFITNLANPKCILFFLALFTLVIRDTQFGWIDIAFILTFFSVTLTWFVCLVLLLSHPKIENALKRWQPLIIKVTGIFLIGFGVALFFAQA